MPHNLTSPILMNNTQSHAPRWARIKFVLPLLLTFNFSFLIIQCGLDVEDPTPPSPPVWVEKSLPEEWPERGIDAHESGGILLEWELNPSIENVKYYNLFRAENFDLQDSMREFIVIGKVDIESNLPVEYIDRGVITNTVYSYYLIAEDGSGNVSSSSDTVMYRRLSTVPSINMSPNGLTAELPINRSLAWSPGYYSNMENYTITILNLENMLILRREVIPGNYIGSTEYFHIPDSVQMVSGTFYQWRVDMSAQYINGCETAGSESLWATFLFTGG